MDPNVLKYYRPVLSLLLFVSNVIERVVAILLKDHILISKLDDIMQSLYKTDQNTETASVRVQIDLLDAEDTGVAAILVILKVFPL